MREHEFQFHASPMGKICGVTSQSIGDYRLTVIVLPKFWSRHRTPPQAYTWHPETQHMIVSTYETHQFQITASTEEQMNICSTLETATMRDGGLSDELLLNRVVPENHAGTVAGMMNERGAYGDLFSLCCLYHQSNMGNLHSMLETSQKNSILHLFVMKQLVDEIKPLMRHLRASYLRVAERSSSLRGRITGNGMLQYASTGSTELECEFEEFTTNIPLYRVIITALSVVQNHPENRTSSLWNLGKEAQQIRIKLNHIRPYNVRQAIHVARQLRLNSLERQRWWRPLELAVSILKREGMELQNTSNMNGFVWNINTATEIWEEITLAGAKAAVKLGTSPRSFCIGQGEKRDDVEIFDPWAKTEGENHANGAIRPDIILHDGQDLHCWDSKYKFIGNGTGSADDRYQLFAYSHLVRHGIAHEGPTRLALLYPAMDGVGVRLDQTRMPPQPKPKGEIVLSSLALPFPSRETVQDQRSWRLYLDSLTQTLYASLSF